MTGYSRDKIAPVFEQGRPATRDPGENPPGQRASAPTGQFDIGPGGSIHPPFKNPEWEWERDHVKEGVAKVGAGIEKVVDSVGAGVRKLNDTRKATGLLGNPYPPNTPIDPYYLSTESRMGSTLATDASSDVREYVKGLFGHAKGVAESGTDKQKAGGSQAVQQAVEAGGSQGVQQAVEAGGSQGVQHAVESAMQTAQEAAGSATQSAQDAISATKQSAYDSAAGLTMTTNCPICGRQSMASPGIAVVCPHCDSTFPSRRMGGMWSHVAEDLRKPFRREGG